LLAIFSCCCPTTGKNPPANGKREPMPEEMS
jgi:hypothetical protein